MRIGVNAMPLRVGGGGARYVFTELMARLLAGDDDHEYVIFTHPLGSRVVQQIPGLHAHLALAAGRRPRARVVELPHEDQIFRHRDEFDLFFGPLNNLQPRIYDRPSVAILHDIQEQYFPQYFSTGELAARREIYPEICRAATTLVTISQFCKQCIVEKFGIDPGKIKVVHPAPQAALVERDPNDPGRWGRQPLPTDYFFYPAMRYPHKNHALLLDALLELHRRGRRELSIVFTGFDWPGGVNLPAEIERRGLTAACRVFSEVSVDELRFLYRHAIATVMPTRFEGFGLPAVESLACGCPLVCSDIPALRELVGEHALYFDPTRLDDLVVRLERLVDDAPLRQRMVAEGGAAVRRFTWDAAAEQLQEIFRAAPNRFLGAAAANRYRGATAPAGRGAGGEGEAPAEPGSRATARLGGSLALPSLHGQDRPRIGILLTDAGRPESVAEALSSIWATGYGDVFVRALVPAGQYAAAAEQFLRESGVPFERVAADAELDWPRVRRLAEEEQLDLVGEVSALRGRLLTTGLHSLADAFQRDVERREAQPALYVVEAWEERGAPDTHNGEPAPLTVARMRELGDGLWKIENYLYPELVWINPRAVASWNDAAAALRSRDWRWELVKLAHRSGRLDVVRRSVAVVHPEWVSLSARLRALRAGFEAVYAQNGSAAAQGWLTALKPVLRPASRVLPKRIREKGEQIWRHLTRR